MYSITHTYSMGAAEGHSGEYRASLPAADSGGARGGKWYLDVLLWLARGQLRELNRDLGM